MIRDVLGWPHVDDGGGWLIFALPPAEVAVHPAEGPRGHEPYLMCGDREATVDALEAKGVEVSALSEEPWGLLVQIRVPGLGPTGVYQPRHASSLDD